MIGGVISLFIFTLIAYWLASEISIRYKVANQMLLQNTIFFHWGLTILYYVYSQFNASDSRTYYSSVLNYRRGEKWADFYGSGTTFIEWLSYPFINGLGFNYEACMVLFSFFGLLGFFFFHLFIQERVKFPVRFYGYPLTTIFMFLPNMHFWTASLGKGSIIFLGISMVFFALNKPDKRIFILIIGGLLVYHIRPHVMLTIVVAAVVAAVFSNKGVGIFARILILAGSVVAFGYIFQDALRLVGIDQATFFEEGVDLSKRAKSLSSAGSGVDITNYNQAMKLFTFLYRPLFVDNPSAFGIFVSFENLFYLVLTIQFFARGGLGFIIRGDFITKTAFLSFLAASIALAQISGNLGIAIRQKSQIMMLFLFVVAYFFQEIELKKWRRRQRMIERRKKMLAGEG